MRKPRQPAPTCPLHTYVRLAANGHCYVCEGVCQKKLDRLTREHFKAAAPAEMKMLEVSTGRVVCFGVPKVRRRRR